MLRGVRSIVCCTVWVYGRFSENSADLCLNQRRVFLPDLTCVVVLGVQQKAKIWQQLRPVLQLSFGGNCGDKDTCKSGLNYHSINKNKGNPLSNLKNSISKRQTKAI